MNRRTVVKFKVWLCWKAIFFSLECAEKLLEIVNQTKHEKISQPDNILLPCFEDSGNVR